MYLIIGGSGYLGSYLIKNIINNTNENIISTYSVIKPDSLEYSNHVKWVKLDITNLEDVECFFKNHLQDEIQYKCLYLAAYHHPDKVEQNPETGWNTNVFALDNFLKKAKSKIKSLYYASTDSVYGESINEYVFNENDSYNPVNTYGRTKAIAEQLVLMNGFSVIRYSLLMGPSLLKGKKHFYDIIVDSLSASKDIEMFVDSKRSVISFEMASDFTIRLMENHYKRSDIMNITTNSHLSKFDMALGIAKEHNFDPNFLKKSSISNQDNFISKRAKNTLISNNKMRNILGIKKEISYEY